MFALFLKNRLDKFGIHYGWVIVFMAFLTSMFSSAIISTPQILILPITNAYGWGISDVTSSIGVMYLILASFAPFGGALILKFGIALRMPTEDEWLYFLEMDYLDLP